MTEYSSEFYSELKRISFSLQNSQELNNIKIKEIIELLEKIHLNSGSNLFENRKREKLLEEIYKKNEIIEKQIVQLNDSQSKISDIKYSVIVLGFAVCYWLAQILEVLKKLH